MSLQLEITASAGKDHAKAMREPLLSAHSILRPPLKELSLALVGDRKMSELHERFMGIAGPTDVLTFPLETDSRGRVISGEVVVCVPHAMRHVREHGGGVRRELLLYALHGMLHLAGFNDKTESGYRRMHRKEDQILMALGMGPVFAGSPPPAARSSSVLNGRLRREC